MRAAIVALACMLPLGSEAALTEAEKQLLLQANISSATATELGRTADREGLERIIGLEDERLVHAFDSGMLQARIGVMPPPVEALVIAHFHHPKVGAALRALTARYQTRALFDLHYARIEAAYRTDEPSFTQILRTDQRGIEEPLLRIAGKFPASGPEGNMAVLFLGGRKHPGAVPLLIASLEEGHGETRSRVRVTRAIGLLLNYPSVDVWRQAAAEIERLRREGRIDDEAYASARRQLDPPLSDPERYLQIFRSRDAFSLYLRQREAISPSLAQIDALRETDPRQYAAKYAEYAAKLEPIAARIADDGVARAVGAHYYRVGMFLRFRLRDPAAAAAPLARSARYRHMLGQVALADLYQFELRDKDAAIRAYQAALNEASAQPSSRMNAWWRAWLAQEIEYLRTGQPFRGRIPEAAIGGFFEAMNLNAVMVMGFVAREVPKIAGAGPQPPLPGQPLNTLADWAPLESTLARVDRRDLAAKLNSLPNSRLALMATFAQMSALQSSQAILAYLERNDPSGYWSTVLLGTVAYYESRAAAGRDEALGTGTAQLLPGMADAAKPNPLGAAAAQFLKARRLRVVAEKP
jgi:hypothetical protein